MPSENRDLTNYLKTCIHIAKHATADLDTNLTINTTQCWDSDELILQIYKNGIYTNSINVPPLRSNNDVILFCIDIIIPKLKQILNNKSIQIRKRVLVKKIV